MAASEALLPFDKGSGASTSNDEVSSARQRRRRSTKKPGIGKSSSIVLKEGTKSLELNTLSLDSTQSPRKWYNMKTDLIQGMEPNDTTDGSNQVSLQSIKSESLSGSGRQRHSRTKKKSRLDFTTTPQPPHGAELEDSTAGVASLLQKRLHQMEDNSGGEVSVHKRDSEPVPGRPLPAAANLDTHSSRSCDLDDVPPCTDILGIIVHGTDELKASVYLTHPSVRVSIVDARLGMLLRKSVREKCVTSYYEKDNPAVDYILPVLTQPYECSRHRAVKGTLKAEWEESLTFNEALTYFTSNEDVVIFFELLDFVTAESCGGYNEKNQTNHMPWYQIAWAFLRPSGKICKSKMGQKIRLQLYRFPRNPFQRSTENSEVYRLWSRYYRGTYPSTLYVTLKAISMALPKEDLPQPSRRSMFPLQEEKGSLTYEEMIQRQASRKSIHITTGSMPLSANLRLPGQACQIPTTHLCTLHPTPMGCSSLAFSKSGHLLAAGCCADQDDTYPLVIFELPSFKPVVVTEGHRGIIYDICWDKSDKLLATASADGIVKLWYLEDSSLPDPLVTLTHPCYVYSVCFLTGSQWKGSTVLSTGAYDGYIRVWSIANGSSQIMAEFHGRSGGHINSIVWSKKASILYAADSKGILGLWHKKDSMWTLKQKIDVVNGQSLSAISLHPNGRKILLHTLRGMLAMVDLRVDHISCEYGGIRPSSLERCTSLLSPCGGLVFAGAQNGNIHVWNTDTGQQLHIYDDLPLKSAVGAMAYHPCEHMVVFSSFGSYQPLLVFNHIMGSTHQLPEATTATATGSTRQKGQSPGIVSDAERESTFRMEGSTPRLEGSTSRLEVQLKMTQRLSDLARTLDGVKTRTKS